MLQKAGALGLKATSGRIVSSDRDDPQSYSSLGARWLTVEQLCGPGGDRIG